MSPAASVLELHDVDLLFAELRSEEVTRRLARLGFPPVAAGALERERERVAEGVDRRWMQHYGRAQSRYGRAVVRVRERVCLGCFITLPRSASPGPGESLTVCESCGRILYWTPSTPPSGLLSSRATEDSTGDGEQEIGIGSTTERPAAGGRGRAGAARRRVHDTAGDPSHRLHDDD